MQLNLGGFQTYKDAILMGSNGLKKLLTKIDRDCKMVKM